MSSSQSSEKDALRYLADRENWAGDPHDQTSTLYGHFTPYEMARLALGLPERESEETRYPAGVGASSRTAEVYVPSLLCGVDGEPPVYVNTIVAATGDAAIAYAIGSGDLPEAEDGESYPVRRVLMRELDPIACRARGYEEGWWVECTSRSKRAHSFWRIEG